MAVAAAFSTLLLLLKTATASKAAAKVAFYI
jgi:hypothetical protein